MKAAPEGVAMASEIRRTNQENLDFLAEPLEPKKRQALELVCKELGLDREVFEHLEFEARLLRDFEAYGKAELKTPREKIKALQTVEELANALHAAMEKLDSFESVDVLNRLPPTSTIQVLTKQTLTVCVGDPKSRAECIMGGIFPDPDATFTYSLHPTGGALIGRVGHISLEVKNLATAAREERLAFGELGKTGGRKAVLYKYAYRVSEIFDCVKAAGFSPGRGGKFEQLCEAVFIAAGVPTEPEGAIRKFIELRNAAANSPDMEPF